MGISGWSTIHLCMKFDFHSQASVHNSTAVHCSYLQFAHIRIGFSFVFNSKLNNKQKGTHARVCVCEFIGELKVSEKECVCVCVSSISFHSTRSQNTQSTHIHRGIHDHKQRKLKDVHHQCIMFWRGNDMYEE